MRPKGTSQLQGGRWQLSNPSRLQAGLLKELYSSKQYGSLLGGGGMGDSGKQPQLPHLSLGPLFVMSCMSKAAAAPPCCMPHCASDQAKQARTWQVLLAPTLLLLSP